MSRHPHLSPTQGLPLWLLITLSHLSPYRNDAFPSGNEGDPQYAMIDVGKDQWVASVAWRHLGRLDRLEVPTGDCLGIRNQTLPVTVRPESLSGEWWEGCTNLDCGDDSSEAARTGYRGRRKVPRFLMIGRSGFGRCSSPQSSTSSLLLVTLISTSKPSSACGCLGQSNPTTMDCVVRSRARDTTTVIPHKHRVVSSRNERVVAMIVAFGSKIV
jgi:hypothetical protein